MSRRDIALRLTSLKCKIKKYRFAALIERGLVALVVNVRELVEEELSGRVGELDGVFNLLRREKHLRLHQLGELGHHRIAAHRGNCHLQQINR